MDAFRWGKVSQGVGYAGRAAWSSRVQGESQARLKFENKNPPLWVIFGRMLLALTTAIQSV
jgi:hypothetical protein